MRCLFVTYFYIYFYHDYMMTNKAVQDKTAQVPATIRENVVCVSM